MVLAEQQLQQLTGLNVPYDIFWALLHLDYVEASCGADLEFETAPLFVLLLRPDHLLDPGTANNLLQGIRAYVGLSFLEDPGMSHDGSLKLVSVIYYAHISP